MSSTKGQHAAPMTALRLIQDRARKFYIEGPSDWGRYRALTHAEQIRFIVHKNGLTALFSRP